MKLIISAAIALGIVGAMLFASAPAQAADGLPATCPNISKLTVTDSDLSNYHLYSWSGKSPYNGADQEWIVERSDDAGANWSVVQTSTSRSYSHSLDVTPDVRYRFTAQGAGDSCEYDPPATPGAPFMKSKLYF